MKRALKALASAATILVALYIAAVGYLFANQRSYVFKPAGTLATPVEKGLSAEVVTLHAEDGTELTGWYEAAEPGKPTILYFHGNAGNVSERADRFKQIVASGFGYLAVSYRGYPGSGGAPSEAAFVADGIMEFDWLKQRSRSIVTYGESLGTGVAVEVAAARPPAAVILEAPFTAVLDIAEATYPWVPVKYLMRDPFLSRDHIGQVHVPLLIIHGSADATVPVEQGKALFKLANEPKELVIVDGAGHGDLWKKGLWPAAVAFLENHGVVHQFALGSARVRQAAR